MKFDLRQARFIPQSNVTTKEASLLDLLEVKVKDEVKYDLYFNPVKAQNWSIDKSFIENQNDNQGWTASIQGNYVFLIKTTGDVPKEMLPRFLKGECGNSFKSDYFTLITSVVFNLEKEKGFFLTKEECDIEGVEVYSVSDVKETVKGEEVVEEHVIGVMQPVEHFNDSIYLKDEKLTETYSNPFISIIEEEAEVEENVF